MDCTAWWILHDVYGCFQKIRVVNPPKWMVDFMENPIKMDDLGVTLFLETPIYIFICLLLFNESMDFWACEMMNSHARCILS